MMCAGRQGLRGDRLQVLPSGVEGLHVCALHVAHVVLARSEPGADRSREPSVRRSARRRRSRGAGSRVPRRRASRARAASPSRFSDASPRAVRASASCTRSPSSAPGLEPSPSRPARRPSPEASTRRAPRRSERRASDAARAPSEPSFRAFAYASRAIARLAALTSAAAVSWASSSGGAPSSSVRNSTAWSRWYARISIELLARSLCEPLGEARVVLRARELREPRVGDLADEGVLEAIRGLARDRRARLAQEELALEQVVERARRDPATSGDEMLERAPPEDAPDDRRRAGAGSSRPARGGRCARR